jgi:hypothetical protein
MLPTPLRTLLKQYLFPTLTLSPLLLLAGCRLYEPPRYARLKFHSGQPCTRVLMIGDSLTYYNDLPGLLQQLSASESAPIDIEQKTFPLRSLQGHIDLDDSLERIRDGHFDYVILQDFSDKPITDYQGSLNSFVKFTQAVDRAGSKAIIFENWLHKDSDQKYEPMQAAYAKIVERTHALAAPIGTAWKFCDSDRSDIQLLLDDRHPTDAGTYLAACVLYDTLYHKHSADLPANLPGPKLPQTTLTALRTFADRATSNSVP